MICTANSAAFVLEFAIFWLHMSGLRGVGWTGMHGHYCKAFS